MVTRLLVPIHTDGLFLESDTLMTEASADFTRLPYFNGDRDVNSGTAFLSEKITSRPLQNQNLRHGAGLHLHWSMPDALTKGVHIPNSKANEKPGMVFPKTPNRWLIIRKGGGLDDKQWVVESDFLWPEEADLQNIGLITAGDLNQMGEFLSHAWALFTAIPSAEEGVAPIIELLQNGLVDLEISLPDPLAEEMTLASTLSALTDELEELIQVNNKWTAPLDPLLNKLVSLKGNPENFSQETSSQFGLHSHLNKLIQLLKQSKAYLSLLQLENQENSDKINKEIDQLKLRKNKVLEIISTGDASILDNERAVLNRLANSKQLIDIDIPAKNREIQNIEDEIKRLTDHIFLLESQKSIDEEELSLKRLESERLTNEILTLQTAILPNQERRDALLAEIGSVPTETIAALEQQKIIKTQEKENLEQEKSDLLNELDELNNSDDGLVAQNQNLVQKTEDQANVDTTLKSLISNHGLKDDEDLPLLSADQIDAILGNLYTINEEIETSKDNIIALEQGIDFEALEAELANKEEKEAAAEVLRLSIIDKLDPDSDSFTSNEQATRFYILSMESLTVEIDLINTGIVNLNQRITENNDRITEITTNLIPALDTEIAELDRRIEYKTLVEDLIPKEQDILQKQETNTAIIGRMNELTTTISDATALIASQKTEKSNQNNLLIVAKEELQAFNSQLTANDSEIDTFRDDIFDLKTKLKESKSNLVTIDSELEFKQKELLKADKTPETYLKRRNRSISIPIEIETSQASHQPFRYMGRVLPAEAYSVTDANPFEYYDQLSVIAYGEPTFSALYSNCKSVFGFHDEEASPNAEDPLNYHLFGWYDNAEDDFLKEILKDSPENILETLQKEANWTIDAEENGIIPTEISQVICYSSLQFIGLGINKTEAEEKFNAIIQANLEASNQELQGLPPPTEAQIQSGATTIWNRLVAQSWVTLLPNDTSQEFDAIFSTLKTRKENSIREELKLSNDVTIIFDRYEVEKALIDLTTESFKNTSVVIADTSSEALSSYLGHALVPLPEMKEKKDLELQIRALNAQITDMEDLVANGRAEDAELKLLTDKKDGLATQLRSKDLDIKDLTPENQSTRNKIEEQLETLFFADDLNARQLDIRSKMEEARLSKRYNAVSTDHIWAIRSEGDASQNAKELAEAAKLPPTLNERLADKLDRLNRLQKQFGENSFNIESGKQRLFSDWYKYMLCSYPPEDSSLKFPDIDEVRYFIQQKDIMPLYEMIMATGEVELNHLTAPTYATDHLSFTPDSDVIEAIKTELGKTHTPPADPLAKRLASEINELIRTVSLNNIDQLKFKTQGKFDDIKDWPALMASLDNSTTVEISQLKASLGTSVDFILETARVNNYQINDEEKEIVRNALNDVLLEEINALKNLYLGFIQPVDLFLTMLKITDISDWKAFLSRLKMLGNQNPNATLWLGLPEDIRNKLSRNQTNQRWSATEKTSILVSLHKWVAPLPENRVRTRRSYLESLFPNVIHSADKTLFLLKRISAPRFWEPKEPSVLIAGDIVKPSNRFARDGRLHRQGLLECNMLQSDDENHDAYFKLPSDFADVLSLLEAKLNNSPEPHSIGYHQMLSNPWNPFQLEWEVELCPLLEGSNAADGDYNADYLIDNYDLKVNAIEMRLKPGKGKATTGRSPNIYTGRSLITTEAPKNLGIKLKSFLFNDQDRVEQAMATASFDDPYYTTQKALETLESGIPIQSQVLSGFNQAMLMFRQSLQLPIDDPIGFEDYQGFTKLVSTLIGYTQKYAPQPLTDFSPIRTGELNLHQIRVVDTFGQYRQLDFFDPENGADVLGTAMQPSQTDGINSSVSVPLTPSLAQPARLNFRWINSTDADMEMNDHAATNPICGWMMANYADLSLVIFDDKGQYLGAIEQEETPQEEVNEHPERHNWAKWTSAIGKPDVDFNTAIQNTHLRIMVEFIRQKGKIFVEELTDITDTALDAIAPENFASQDATVLLMGRPMALVRASVNLEFKEIHAVQQSWEAFLRDRLRSGTDFRRETDDYTKVQIPVRIGASSQYDDGLVAFWKTDKEGNLQEEQIQINALFGDMPAKEGGDSYHPSFDFLHDNHIPFKVSADDAQDAQYLSMLVDPYAKVHAITGILPVKAIDIPFSHFEKALQSINLTFLAGPILSPAKKILAPLPAIEDKEWSWYEKTNSGENWDVIRQESAINKSKLTEAFSDMLWNQLVLRNWIDTTATAPVLNPLSDRRPLDFDLITIQSDLEALIDALTSLSKQNFKEQAAEPGGIANLLWTVLTDKENVYWLEPYPDNPEMATIIATDERKNPTLDIEVLGVNYNGMGNRIQEILRQNRQGIFEFSTEARLPDDRLWLRDGWLQLNNTSETA